MACAQSDKKKEAAAESRWKEGQHYEVVSDQASAEPMVTEYFSHYCGHCFGFENFVDTVKTAVGVPFFKSHVSYIPQDDSLVAMAMVKAFVIMQELEMEKTLSPAMFNAIHVERAQIYSEEAIKSVMVDNGVDAAQYDQLFASEDVNKRAKEMSEVWMDKRITSVPTLVVNDKYKVNMASVTTIDELIELTIALTKMED